MLKSFPSFAAGKDGKQDVGGAADKDATLQKKVSLVEPQNLMNKG